MGGGERVTVFRQLSTGGVRDVGVKLVRSLLRDRRLVPGVGAAELELMRRCARVGGGEMLWGGSRSRWRLKENAREGKGC